MPDLLGKTPEEAEKILRDAGFDLRGFDNSGIRYGCDYDRHKSYPLQTICYQRPVPGYLTPVYLRAEYEVERSQGNRGDIGLPTEYIFMPEVRGMSLDEARKVLRGAGLPVEKHFTVEVASEYDRCEYDVVCQTSPGPKMRKALTQRGSIKVGRPKPPEPPKPDPAKPDPAKPEPTEPDPFF